MSRWGDSQLGFLAAWLGQVPSLQFVAPGSCFRCWVYGSGGLGRSSNSSSGGGRSSSSSRRSSSSRAAAEQQQEEEDDGPPKGSPRA